LSRKKVFKSCMRQKKLNIRKRKHSFFPNHKISPKEWLLIGLKDEHENIFQLIYS
jgi:hypothetical protein